MCPTWPALPALATLTCQCPALRRTPSTSTLPTTVTTMLTRTWRLNSRSRLSYLKRAHPDDTNAASANCDYHQCSTLSGAAPSSASSSPLCINRKLTLVLVVGLALLLLTPSVSASGFFELQFLDGVHNSTTIHVCLKEFWNSQVNFNRCTFGQKTVIFNEHQHHHNPRQSAVKIPFSFRWIGSFSFTIQLSENSAHSGLNRFVVEDEFAVPGIDWKLRTFHAKDGRIISIRFRIDCDLYYHSEDCATFCRARNDTFGHYSCDKNGRKQCLDGWKGENCDKPKCRSGCNEVHGFCEAPNDCTCRSGWKGANCDECVEYPGCLHGYCLSPFQCICHRNWGGILCDQDLNYCGTHEPCLNEGRCENIAPDNYRCVCRKGFSGVNCQVVEDACATSPCLHGGTCLTLANGTDFKCICKDGFSGQRCERDLNECVSQPCLNGGTCHDLENDFRCTCPSGWTGERCEQDVNECEALVTPCIRASACINKNGSYVCVCEKGFEGAFCEVEVDDCQHKKVNCQNGGFCIDLIDDYRCVCATGFTGHNCDKLDESVCDLIPTHVWRFNDTDCEKICVCQENSKVGCTCQQERMFQESLCERQEGKESVGRQEIRVAFDSAVSSHSCHAIFAIHSLLSGEGHPFCCRIVAPNEVLLQVDESSPLAQFVTRTIFPHILHLVVNSKALERSDWSIVDYCIAFLSSAFVAGLYFVFRSRLKRRRQQKDAQNVVIHCIQNNLKPSSPGEFRSVSPSEGKKLCNTLQYCHTAKLDHCRPQVTLKSKDADECALASSKLFVPA